jgi:The GLUG motif./Domain of unknown function.
MLKKAIQQQGVLGKRFISTILTLAIIIGMLPIISFTASAENANVTGNQAFNVIVYDTSARIEIPVISGAANYKVYLSTSSGLTDFSGASCVFNSNTYNPYVYTLNGDKDVLTPANTISVTALTTYYFYLVTNDGTTETLQSTYIAATRSTSGCYWTDAGNYDTSWYNTVNANYVSSNMVVISTARQLAAFSKLVNNGLDFNGKIVKLSASVDMSANLWTPIGNYYKPFKGTFDGGNYDTSNNYIGANVVSGLHTNSTYDYQGLFGCNSGIVKNTGVVDGYITGSYGVGGVAGSTSGTVDHCYSTCKIKGNNNSIGGIAGHSEAGTVSNCYNTGDITGNAYVGGVVGSNYNGAITNCYNTGEITGTVQHCGGVAGSCIKGSVSSCYNTGKINGVNNVGGIIGISTESATINKCYNMGAINGTNSVGGVIGFMDVGVLCSDVYNTGDIAGTTNVRTIAGNSIGSIKTSYNIGKVNTVDDYSYYNASGIKTASDAASLKNTGNLTGFDLAVWCNSPTQYAAGGVFTSENPVNKGYPVLKAFGYTDGSDIDSQFQKEDSTGCYLIKNAYQLDLVRNYSSDTMKVFILANNIDLSPVQYNKTQVTDGSWNSIGTFGTAFCGTFNGNGNSISGLYIDKSTTTCLGLFSYATNSSISNIGMVDSYISGLSEVGTIAGYNSGMVSSCYNTGEVIGYGCYSGGIVGYSEGLISNCYNTGSVVSAAASMLEFGGIVGHASNTVLNCYNIGTINGACDGVGGVVGHLISNGVLSNCYNTGKIFSEGSSVGGVVGDNDLSSSISNSYNTGAIVSTQASGYAIGGIAGLSNGTILNCFNTGSITVTGTSSYGIGGITGYAFTNNSKVSNCYNTGVITAIGGDCYNIGGIIGKNNTTAVSNNYYCGTNAGIGGTGAAQNGTAPFSALTNSSISAGTAATAIEHTELNTSSTWKTALGENFNISYSGYTASPSGFTAVNGNSIKGTSVGGANITSSFTITQNSLTSTGFTGPTFQIIVPISLGLTIAKAAPTINVSSDSYSVNAGNPITLTATITNGSTPTGTVTFKNGSTTIGSTTTITSGVASLQYTPTEANGLSITAEYSGDSTNGNATSTPVVITVTKNQPAITMLASPSSPETYPNEVTFTASLKDIYGSAEGQTITFTIDGTSYITTTNDSGEATYKLTPSSAKAYVTKASFAGDTNNESAETGDLTFSYNKGTQTTPDISIQGGSTEVTYGYSSSNYKATASGGESTGAYQYRSSDSSVVSVDSATGSLTVNGAGSAIIYVKRLGDGNYNDSAEGELTINVAQKTITSTITPRNKVYNAKTDAAVNAINYTGIEGSDDVSIIKGTIVFSDKIAGNSKTVTASGYILNGTKAANYKLGTITVHTANITPAPLTIVNTSVKDKTYDGTVMAEFSSTPALLGVISGDTLALTNGTPTFASKNYSGSAATVNITDFMISGTDAVNYILTQPGSTSALIAKKTLNVSVSPMTIKVGQAVPSLTVNISGFADGETQSTITGFEKPTAIINCGSTTAPVTNESMDVTYNGGNATNNYMFNYSNTTQLTIQAVSVSNGDYQVTGNYSTTENPTNLNNKDLTIAPINGYDLISTDGTTWSFSLKVQTEALNRLVSFKLKKSSDGTQTESTLIYYNLDKTAPTGTVTVSNNNWKSFLNTITFGLFFKETVNVSITGEDSLSGVKTIEYQKVSDKTAYDENGTWTTYNAFTVSPNEKCIVYAKITDKAGNITIINSNGVVVYTDSSLSSTTEYFDKDTTRQGYKDIVVNINPGNNALNGIKNSQNTLVKDTDYTIDGSTVTLKKEYLKTVVNGTIALTFSFNPMGETFDKGDEPATACLNIVELIDAASPKFTTNLSGEITYAKGDTAAPLTVNASVIDNGEISYQWYESTENKTNGTAISGGTTATYVPKTDKTGVVYYYVVATNTNGTVTGDKTATTTSDIYKVIVNNVPDTVKGEVIDKAGQSVKEIDVQVTTEANGNKTVDIKSNEAILIKQPDGTKAPLSDISKLSLEVKDNTNASISPDGTIQVKGLANNTESKIAVTYDLGNGQNITIGYMDVKVDGNGNVTFTSTLIDPNGIITDKSTGKVIAGANVTLYYADTARNRAAGKTPDTVVQLPLVDGFKPNNNRNSQESDIFGAYAFMVFPTSDYYIVATKDGYNRFASSTISVENELVKHDIQMTPVKTDALPKTGSLVDGTTLTITGIFLLLIGLFLVRKKRV